MKLLYVTSLSGIRINGFMRSAIVAAKNLGIDFTMACNMDEADKDLYAEDCQKYGIKVIHIDFDRNPIAAKNWLAKKQLLELMNKEHFDVVHCNTPIGGVLGRVCAHKAKIPLVIYQAHGFHFWKGAPVKNWLFYYTIERYLATYTDILVTINKEDYNRAQKFHLKDDGIVKYIHGVGVNTEKFRSSDFDVDRIRAGLEIPMDSKVFITVGELIERKNQKTVIEAFDKAHIDGSILLICGNGVLMDELTEFVKSKGLSSRVRLLGYRQDVSDILRASDIFVFPSLQEGLPVALMEAMACGLPCIASSIRGNVDLLGEKYDYLFEPKDCIKLADMMVQILDRAEIVGAYCKESIKEFDFEHVKKEYECLYSEAKQKLCIDHV